MRVLHILESRDHDRAADYATDVILGLQQINLDQYVVTDRQSPRMRELKKSGVKVSTRLLPAALGPLRRLWIQGLVAHLQPDVAQCWTRGAARLAPSGKMPVVGWLGGYDDPERLPRCSYLVSASKDSASRLAQYKDSGVKTQFIPPFSEFSAAPPLDRHALATSRDATVLLCPAPLHPDSRHETTFAALQNLPHCVAWLVGEGPFRRVLERKAQDLGVIDRVRFAPLRLNRGALLRAADLCVLTAPDRPLGTLIPQAWAAGTPIIAAHQNTSTAPLDDGTNGLLIPAGDETALRHAVIRTCDEKLLRKRLAAEGYAAYLGRYARDAVIRQWMDLYRQIAANK